MGRKKMNGIPSINTFRNSALANNITFMNYYTRLLELSISMFEWQNLPDTMDARYMEQCLFERGNVLLYFDEELNEFLSLPALIGGQLDVYNIPIERTAYANNGYQYRANKSNSVICFNNMLLSPSHNDIYSYSLRLYEIDRTIDVNVKAQKTPVLIKCDENEKLTMQNLYQQYDGNAPVIYGYESLRSEGLTVLKTDAPYLADKLYQLKENIWNEALTYLGIPNVSIQKKERLITDEVQRAMGGTLASRNSRLMMRLKACDEFNRMYGTNIRCRYRVDVEEQNDMHGMEEGELVE